MSTRTQSAGGGVATPPVTDTQPPRSSARWWALAVIGLAQLMVVLDATIVNIALPSAQRDLGFSNDLRQWIVTAYSLAFGSLLLLGGRLADLFGRRNTFLIGVIGFGVVSALGGAAENFTMLVIARALQGMFGALLAPSALSLLTTTFTDPKERGRAFGVFGAIAGSGGAIGLLLGGVLTEHLDWRWTLYVNVVIAVLAVLGALAFVRSEAPSTRQRLDLTGTVLVAAGLFGIVYGFANAETYSWGDPLCWAFLAGGGVLIAAFLAWETRTAHPLLPLRVLADRNRAASYLSVFIGGAGMFGVFLFLTYYLQTTLGYTPIQTGLGFLPMVGALMLVAQLSTNLLVPKLGPKPVVPVGMALAVCGLLWLTNLGIHSSYTADVLPALVLIGVGLALVMPVAMSLATLGVATRDQGVASATVNTMQQVGGSIGTALFNTIAATAASDYLADHRTDPDVAAQAGLHSYAAAYWWAAGFFAAGLVIAVLLYRKGRPYGKTAKSHTDTAAPRQGTGADDGGATGQTAGPVVSGISVHGTVLTASGAAAAAATVTLIDAAGSQIDRASADEAGRYGLLAPPHGHYVLLASAGGHEPKATPLAVDTEPYRLDTMLDGVKGALTGLVTSGTDPVAGALAVATDGHGAVAAAARTDETGRYTLTGLLAGDYTLVVDGAGYSSARPVTVTGSRQPLDIALSDA